MEKHVINSDVAGLVWKWIKERGGIAIWRSINLCNPGASWTTPAKTDDGLPYPKPTWQTSNEPERIITDPKDVSVSKYKEVARFHVAIRPGGSLNFVLTDGSSRKVWKSVEKFGNGATYEFDYLTQEAVILAPIYTIPLIHWYETHKEEIK